MAKRLYAYDVGSTYTKVAAFDKTDAALKLIDRSEVPTTIRDIDVGLQHARQRLKDVEADGKIDALVLAASSAAGGLRMVAMGYMPRVTTKAAKEVAMNAGARIMEVLSHEDPPDERVQILREIRPDIILLTGGTDGGDREAILEDAQLIIKSQVEAIVVVAGNKDAQPQIETLFNTAAVPYKRVRNVLPTIHELYVQSAREAIHQQFIRQIAKADGLQKLIDQVSDQKVVPTPGAVLLAAELLAKGTHSESGMGDLIVIDIGGATTDVHSILPAMDKLSIEERGLVVTNDKQTSFRTVEGNLGMRISATGILEAVGARGVLAKIGQYDEKLEEKLIAYTAFLEKNAAHIPTDEIEHRFDTGLAITAIEVALKRHAGHLAQDYDPVMGTAPGTPVGRDLRNVKLVVAIGGVLAHSSPDRRDHILQQAFLNPGMSLLPTQPKFFVDGRYLMYAVGLMSADCPERTLKFAKDYVSGIEKY